MRRADPLRVAEAKLQGALLRLDAVASVEANATKLAELGGDPDVISFKVDQMMAERLAKVRGAKYSSLPPRVGFNP